MDDGKLDKIINGLTCCINHNDCKKCPYANEYDPTFDCIDRTRKDALELLKEQAVKTAGDNKIPLKW